MYFERQIDKYLITWKNSPRHKPLLLRGARQVGKSMSIRHLGEQFENYAEVNFEKQREFRQIFQGTSDVRKIISSIGALLKVSIIEGKTLLFLDEIQSCPEALHSLWSFKEDLPGLHVVAAGSLLEFTLKDMPAFGVGRIHSMFMYPMSFDEFLLAMGYKELVELKKQANYANPLPKELHDTLVQQFRVFLLIGGMPAGVATWVETNDYQQVVEELGDIQQSYYDDFAKYSKSIDPLLLRNTLRSVIMQIGSKFTYSRVDGDFRADNVKRALSMLCDAGIVKIVHHSSGNGLPLGSEVNEKFRKYHYLDSGLLLRIMDTELGGSHSLTELVLAGASEDLVNKGTLTEMVAGWELIKSMSPNIEHDLYYWQNISNGASSEVDYLIARDMKILPIEIKSGVSGKMKSLRLFMNKKHLLDAKRCSLENFGIIEFIDESDSKLPDAVKKICIHPLYCISTL